MKKIIALAISIIMVISCTACGAPSPTNVANKFLQAIKDQDAEAIAEVYAGKDFDFGMNKLNDELSGEKSDAEATDEKQAEDDIFADVEEELGTKLLDFDYEVANEKIDGDKATVDVTITTYEFGKEFSKFFTDYIAQAFVLMFDEDGESKIDELSKTMLQNMMDNLAEKTYTQTAQLELEKVDNQWVVSEISDTGDFMNALSGGMIESFSSLENILGSEE